MADVDVGVLRRAAALLDTLPDWPWQAVELTDADLHGDPEHDLDVQPDPHAHARDLEAARTYATWRGLVDAHGTPLVGQALPGGSAPRPVVQPVWRFAADAPALLDAVLAQARALWRHTQGVPAPRPEPDDAAGQLAVVTAAQLERAARAAYEAGDEPGPSWDGLPEPARAMWRDRTLAALLAVMG